MIFVDTCALIAFFHNRIQRMRQGGILDIIHISKEIEEESWHVFEEFNKDKMWSFTDCTSKVVMDSLRIKKYLPLITISIKWDLPERHNTFRGL